MDATRVLSRLCELIDAQAWDDLRPLLHDDFRCRYVHTGEEFDADSWVRLNAEYPGFDHLVMEDLVGSEDRAVARCHVTGYVDGALVSFQVASFVTTAHGRITELVEVWTDVNQAAPADARPSAAPAV